MRSRWLIAASLTLCLNTIPAWAEQKPRGLDIYWVDTEGGAATLIVTPAGESVLIDCGNPGTRDAERIHKVATQQAGLKAIDHLIITHWHTDHYGGVAHLTRLMPVRHFYDHGIPDSLEEDPKNFPLLIQAYKTATQGKSRTVKAGDEVALTQEGSPAVRLACLCGSGEVVPDKPGAAENPAAAAHHPMEPDKTDNARSLVDARSYVGVRFYVAGYLTRN